MLRVFSNNSCLLPLNFSIPFLDNECDELGLGRSIKCCGRICFGGSLNLVSRIIFYLNGLEDLKRSVAFLSSFYPVYTTAKDI